MGVVPRLPHLLCHILSTTTTTSTTTITHLLAPQCHQRLPQREETHQPGEEFRLHLCLHHMLRKDILICVHLHPLLFTRQSLLIHIHLHPLLLMRQSHLIHTHLHLLLLMRQSLLAVDMGRSDLLAQRQSSPM